MSEVELLLLDQTKNCTVYTIHFLADDMHEFEKFVARFREDAVLGNGGEKKTGTYEEDDSLKGYVVTLQRFEELLEEGVKEGSVTISEREIKTDKIFEL